jgi:hypothetical protein
MDIEIGHTNLQVNGDGKAGLYKLGPNPTPAPPLTPEQGREYERQADKAFRNGGTDAVVYVRLNAGG